MARKYWLDAPRAGAWGVWALASLALLGGCNDSSNSEDGGVDGGLDSGAVDAGPDAEADSGTDGATDSGPDAPGPDASNDGAMDAGLDADAGDADAGEPGFTVPGLDSRPENPCLPPADGNMWTLLSDTPCFERDTDNALVPISALIPFDINSALWSDFASKQRLLSLPDGATLDVVTTAGDSLNDIEFPEGTMFIKTFSLEGRRLETRFLVHHPARTDGDGGVTAATWEGYAYRWEDDQSDAYLITEANWDPNGTTGVIIPLSPPVNNLTQWRIPWTPATHTDPAVEGPVDNMCMRCHTQAAGYALGPELGQLNRLYTYESTGREANQLYTWEELGLFADPLPARDQWPTLVPYQDLANASDRTLNPAIPTEISWEQAARSFLHSNCSYCHREGGGGLTERFAIQREFGNMFLCNENAQRRAKNPELPVKLFVPGDHAASTLYWRLTDPTPYGQTTSGTQTFGALPEFDGGTPRYRMPYMASELVDSLGETIIRNWINETDSCP